VHTIATASNISAPTQYLEVGDQRYAYRRFGNGKGLPLLCLQHFTGTLDNWDPAVTDPSRPGEVLLFDNAGAGRSSGTVPRTVAAMAHHALAFLDGLQLDCCDVLGYSLGGMVAQAMVLEQPSVFRSLLLVGTAPRGGDDIVHLEKPVSPGTSGIRRCIGIRFCKRSLIDGVALRRRARSIRRGAPPRPTERTVR
jgi:pimeloyl-ACP methyl ester carboxylesterase